jgi:hypothetical protein
VSEVHVAECFERDVAVVGAAGVGGRSVREVVVDDAPASALPVRVVADRASARIASRSRIENHAEPGARVADVTGISATDCGSQPGEVAVGVAYECRVPTHRPGCCRATACVCDRSSGAGAVRHARRGKRRDQQCQTN